MTRYFFSLRRKEGTKPRMSRITLMVHLHPRNPRLGRILTESGVVFLFLIPRLCSFVGRQTAYELRPPGETFGAALQMGEFFRGKEEVVTCGNSKKPLNRNMIFHSAAMLAFF